ncbi:MAG: DUF2321 domain-containing protein, partial [Candidatus Omnitrophica bacterium]|nr:DUF2321 domain-containing protein [Candidatus Omnitrophota bacterium]
MFPIDDDEDEKPRQDIMQVCLYGHVINDEYKESPEKNKDYCDKCGQKTIVKCLNCSADIPGSIYYPGIIGVGPMTKAPGFCHKCGKPFPWNIKNKVKEVSKDTTEEGSETMQINPKVFSSKDVTLQEKLCFVLMPFSEPWSERIWSKHICPIVKQCGL